MSMFRNFVVATALAVSSAAANAALPVYPSVGTENPAIYTFTAANTGDITAYFTGSTAGYTENLGLLVNGVATAITGLNNQTSTYGDSLVLGSATAGDTLTFFINVVTTGDTWYSTKTLNSDGVNHVFSAMYGGDPIVPAGRYVAFEDLPNGGNLNYFDETFVFTNVATVITGTPEPATWAMLLAGFGLVGTSMRRRKRNIVAS